MVTATQVLLAVSYVISIVMNALSGTGTFGPNIGDVSDDYPTYVTPDGLTFSIWAVIYTLLTLLVIAQFSPSDDGEKLLSQKCKLTGLDCRQRLIAANLLNAIWLPVYVQLYFWIAFVIILTYLIFLVSVYLDMNTKKTSTFCDWLLYAAPISTNASWVLVANFANLITCLREVGWKDEYGVGGSVPAAIAIAVLLTVISCALVYLNNSVMWSAVAAWALFGLYRAQTNENPESFPVKAMSSDLATAAAVLAGANLLAAVVSLGFLLYTNYKARVGPSSPTALPMTAPAAVE